MANAYRDENNVPTIIGVLNTNGATITRIEADPSTHGVEINDDTTGSDFGPANAPRDENNVPGLIAVSEADGFTPVALYVTSDGKLLVDST